MTIRGRNAARFHATNEFLEKLQLNERILIFPVHAAGGEGERGPGAPHNPVRMRVDLVGVGSAREDRRRAVLQFHDASRMGVLFAASSSLGPWQRRLEIWPKGHVERRGEAWRGAKIAGAVAIY